MSGLRALHKNTMQTLGRPHVLPTLTATFLFCMLAYGTVYLFCRLCAVITAVYLPYGTARLLRLTAVAATEIVLTVLLVLPIWLGRLRMAGMLLAGEVPAYGTCFYYFKTKRRYARACAVVLILVLVYGLAGLASYGAFAGVFSLYHAVLVYYLPRVAPLLLVLLLHVALAVTLGILYLLGTFFPFAAIAVGNEELSVREAFARAVCAGRGNLGKHFVFAIRQLLNLALCLVSVMVLYVLWYSHYFNLIYLRYALEEVQ